MKTSTAAVGCDGCGAVIPVMHPTAIFVTLRGPAIGHRKLDCCNAACLAAWATQYVADVAAERGASPQPELVGSRPPRNPQ